MRTLAAICVAFCYISMAGCDHSSDRIVGGNDNSVGESQSAETAPHTVRSDELDGQTILKRLVQEYSTAKTYRDQGKLYLNYRLEGRPIQEPHPFSTAWDADAGLCLRIFNSHIQSDRRLLSCFVFDNDSANLDNQQLFLPVGQQIRLDELFADSIVRHFVGGYADLPLDESEKSQPPKLVPPPVSMLLRQLPFGWIEQSTQAQRLNDQMIDGRLCYVVRSLFGESTADIWVDQQTRLLVQVSLPLRLMARAVLSSGEIENVELIARFHDAAINGPIDESVFRTQPQTDALPVQRFVSIPEPFPSELIGETAPSFQLQQQNGQLIDRLYFDGMPTALLWVNGASAVESAREFSVAVKQFPSDQFRLGIVYSESELANPESSTLEPIAGLKAIAKLSGLPLYFDQQLQTSSLLRIKTIPAIVVMNGDSRVEYAQALTDEKWPAEVAAALSRVKSGENVSAEMRREYQTFLENYHQQLDAVNATKLVGIETAATTLLPIGNQPRNTNAGSLSSEKTLGRRLRAKLAWTNKDFQRAGNIRLSDVAENHTLLVFDGWRTVAELSLEGRTMVRHELDLPDDIAVSCLRGVQSSNNQPSQLSAKYAIFSVQGNQVFLFDQDWQRVATMPDQSFQHEGILDVVFADGSVGTGQQIVVSFAGDRGCYVFDCENRTTKQILKTKAASLAVSSANLFYNDSNSVGVIGSADFSIAAPDGLRFAKMAAYQTDNRAAISMTVANSDNHWNLAGAGANGEIDWYQPIGSQLFETELEPLTLTTAADGNVMLAVADATNQVSFVSDSGVFQGSLTISDTITGLALLQKNDAMFVVVSSESVVSCYELEFE